MRTINLARRFLNRNRVLLRPACPYCQGVLVPTGHEISQVVVPDKSSDKITHNGYYREGYDLGGYNDRAVEYWCEQEKALILIWEGNGTPQYFLRDLQLEGETRILVNQEPAMYNSRLRDLPDDSQVTNVICEGGLGYRTGNMFYDSALGWLIEYWCDNRQELFRASPAESAEIWQQLGLSKRLPNLV